MRENGGFTHDRTVYGHDVSEKRFITHDVRVYRHAQNRPNSCPAKNWTNADCKQYASVERLFFQQPLTCGGDFFDDFLAAELWYFDVSAGIDQVCLGGEAVAHY